MVKRVITDNFKSIRSHSGIAVDYVRGDDSVRLVAVVGSTEFAQESLSGLYETSQSRDYLILTDDLELNGSKVLPERGDEVHEVDDAGTLFVYPVVTSGGGRVFSYSDPSRVVLRVHTRQAR